MPMDAQIPLMVQPPQIASPLDSLGKMMAIKNAAMEAQQRQALMPGQIQQQQQQVEEGQLRLDQTKALNDAYKSALVVNPDGSNDIDTGRLTQSLAASGVGGSQIPAVLKSVTDYKKGIADLQDTQAKVAAAHADNGGALGAAVKSANYDPNLFLTLIDHGVKEGAIDPKGAAPYVQSVTQALQQDPTGASAKQITQQITDMMIARSPKQTELTTAAQTAQARTSDAAAVTAKLPGELAAQVPALQKSQADATLATAKANLTKLTPDQWTAQVDSIVDPKDPNNRVFKSRLAFAARSGDIDGAQKILDQAGEYATAPGKAAAVTAAQLPGDVKKEQLFAPIRMATSLAEAKALREGDNPAFVNVPPAQAASTQAAAIKLDETYSKAKTSADAIKTVLDMAAAGNKAAGANAPLVGVAAVNALNGIKRINSAEIAQYGTAGSLLDKIQGKLQGWTSGQPIPNDVLQDMQALHQQLRGSSYQQYTDGIKSLNLRSGAKLTPAFPDPGGAGGSAAPATPPAGARVQRNSATGQMRWSTDGGKTWQTQ